MNFSYQQSCAGKCKHASVGKAEAAIRSLYVRYPEKKDDRYHAYLCRFCKKWHFGRWHISQWQYDNKTLIHLPYFFSRYVKGHFFWTNILAR